MPRGIGNVQLRILAELKRCAGLQTTQETIRWNLFSQKNTTFEKLSASWNNSFRRAVSNLVKRKRLFVEVRHLENFNECVEHYPGKTLRRDVRDLRISLLPILRDWIDSDDGIRPKYSETENEVHVVRQLKTDSDRINDLKMRWASIEDRIRRTYGTDDLPSDNLLRLICKGRNLFGQGDVNAHGSLNSVVTDVCDDQILSVDIVEDLRAFMTDFLPAGEARALQLKSLIHQIAYSPHRGKCRLREETLEYLHMKSPQLIETMPGYRIRKKRLTPPGWIDYGQFIHRLFDQSVFQKFSFLSLTESKTVQKSMR